MKDKKVNIFMRSICRPADCSPDTIELITEGNYRRAENNGQECWEISYEDTEATGFVGSTTIVRCFGDTMASMERVGDIGSHLIIEKNRKHHCHYGTEFGDMLMGIYTKRIINRLDEDGGQLYFNYTIDINSVLISENEVFLEITLP